MLNNIELNQTSKPYYQWVLFAFISITLISCSDESQDTSLAVHQNSELEETDRDASIFALRGSNRGSSNNFMGLDLLMTNKLGKAFECGNGNLTFEATIKAKNKKLNSLKLDDNNVEIHCGSESGKVALVVDNSGSESGFLDKLKTSLSKVSDLILNQHGKAGIVRVSTDSSVMQDMTDEIGKLDNAIDRMTINNGWTALWDGIRMGHEMLENSYDKNPEDSESSDFSVFCNKHPKNSMIVFTDGKENNSASEQEYDHELYPGDGINTTFDDLLDFKINDVSTPVYTIGFGDDVDHKLLKDLASKTGGRHIKIFSDKRISYVYEKISDYSKSIRQVCFQLPKEYCGDLELSINIKYQPKDNESDIEKKVTDQKIKIPCQS